MNNKQEKYTKEQLVFLEKSVKKLMDNGNIELARIMAQNVVKCIGSEPSNTKIKKLKR